MSRFEVYYDDESYDVINTISGILKDFDIELKEITKDGSEFLTYEIKSLKDTSYKVKIGTYYLDTKFINCVNYDKAVDIINNFFIKQGFEIKDGKPYDKRYDGRDQIYNNEIDTGFTIFGGEDEWEIIQQNGESKVIKFKHNGGSGPLGEFIKD